MAAYNIFSAAPKFRNAGQSVHVATVHNGGMRTASSRPTGDALVIAAAPEMREALLAFLEHGDTKATRLKASQALHDEGRIR